MSAHAGIFNYSGAPLSAEQLQLLSATNEEHGRDAHGRHLGDGVALLHWNQHFDRWSRLERQPHRAGPHVVVAFDGRLDNRDELLLLLHREMAAPHTDVAIVAEAYQRWGREALGRLVGDWTVAIWDQSQRQLLLARDYMGTRPLYYYHRPGALFWSTCLTPLVSCVPDADRLDEEYLAEALTYRTRTDRTVYPDIRAVPPSHVVICSPEGCEPPVRYWDFDVSAELRYSKQDEYAEHLRELVTEAVAVRLRSDRAVWTHVSGGYDSSAIACLSHWLVTTQRVDARDLRFLSYVFSRSVESDERVYMRHVEEWCGRQATQLDADTIEPRWERAARQVDPFRSTCPPSPLNDTLADTPGATLLTGELGDLVMAKNRTHAVALWEHLERGRVGAFARDLGRLSVRKRTSFHRTLWQVCRPVLPESVDEYLYRREWHGRIRTSLRAKDTSLAQGFGLHPDFLARCTPQPTSFSRQVHRFRPSKRTLARGLYHLAGAAGLISPESLRNGHVTHPYSHRPLVNFLLAIPHLALWNAGTQRALMKQALSCVLPPGVLTRDSKGDAGPSLTRELLAFMQTLGDDFDNWCVVRRGYAEAATIADRVYTLGNGVNPGGTYFKRMLILEAWLRGAHG